MQKSVEAIYEDGVLKPIAPLNIPEHKKIRLILEEEPEEPSEILNLASKVYDDLSLKDIEEIEKIVLDRSHFSRN